MKRSYRIAGKVIVAGLVGSALFVAWLFVIPALMPRSDRMDVVEGWGVAILLIIGMLLFIFLSGVLSVVLTFSDISNLGEAFLVSFASGAVTTVVPLLFGVLLGFYVFGLFLLCLGVLVACNLLAVLGGLLTFLLLSYLKKRKLRRGVSEGVK